jgi:hypothetical protein
MGTNEESAEASAPVDSEDPEGLNELDAEQEEATRKRSNLFKALTRTVGRRRWIWISSLGLIMVCWGLVVGVHQGRQWMNRRGEGVFKTLIAAQVQKGLNEERLPPFFVPLPPEASSRAVRIDFTVIWDGVTSFRFKKMELQVRDRLYGFMVDLAQNRKDLKEKGPLLETEMGRILRESLGTEELAIRIKEIKAI